MNTERCSCVAREKNKCSKESTHGGGKMCVKELKSDTLQESVTHLHECVDDIKRGIAGAFPILNLLRRKLDEPIN